MTAKQQYRAAAIIYTIIAMVMAGGVALGVFAMFATLSQAAVAATGLFGTLAAGSVFAAAYAFDKAR